MPATANCARRFPASYRAQKSPAARRGWLAGAECTALVQAGQLTQGQVVKELARLEAGSKRVRRLAASPCVAEHFERTGLDFPPASAASPMVLADRVLLEPDELSVRWPAYFVSARTRAKGCPTHGRALAPADDGRCRRCRRELGVGVDGGATYDVDCLDDELARRELDLDPAPPSATAVALAELEVQGALIESVVELKTENEHALRTQLARYAAGKPTTLLDEWDRID